MRAVFLVVTMIGLTAGSVGAQTSLETPPVGTLAQIMRGIYFPNSNIIFDTQMQDPGAPPDRGSSDGTVSSTFAGIYTGWQVVENAALVLAEGASLINKPGRLCENGQMVPAQRYDFLKYSREMTDVGWAIYLAALEKDQAAVGELTNDLAQACDNCHRIYRSHAQGAELRCLGSGVILPR